MGYSADQFEGVGYQAFTDLLHPDDYERTMEAMRRHLDGRAPLYQVDYRIQRANGAYTWFMDRGYIIERTPDGSPSRLRGLVFDMGIDHSPSEQDDRLLQTVRGLLPTAAQLAGETTGTPVKTCMVCKRLQIADSEWIGITERLPEILPGHVSHGLCPECVAVLYPEYKS